MQYQTGQIARITNGVFLNETVHEANIEHILLDSRQIVFPGSSLFIALQGRKFDGHTFLGNVYQSGVRNFLVSQSTDCEKFPDANFILVENTLASFQQIAAHHRRLFTLPVIGITGSNGKTIVKEWLFQLLHEDHLIARSPKSYNSQIGAPLSILQINEAHTLGIFEAGISQTGEMEKLAAIIAPDIGIFTNLGEAHSEGFPDAAAKLREKLRLFENVKTLIYCCDDELVEREIGNWKLEIGNSTNLIKWSAKNKPADFQIKKINRSDASTTIEIHSGVPPSTPEVNSGQAIHHSLFTIHFTDHASIENAIHCWVLMTHLGIGLKIISKRINNLEPVAMRLELKEGNDGCLIINDSYNSDLTSLNIALDFLVQQSKTPRRTLILSDILQSGQSAENLYNAIAKLVLEKNIDQIIGIGKEVNILDKLLPTKFNKRFYSNTAIFLESFPIHKFKDESILLKGARQFGFEKIADRLATKVHQTALEVNLTALLNNLRVYQSHLRAGTKLMVMVKASAYGSGSVEVAKLLEFQHVDYLAVAYADEGVELRKAGIQLPILVLNPEEATFVALVRNNLEPEIYSLKLLEKYTHFIKSYFRENKNEIPLLKNKISIPIHLKIDSGMHRLGFEEKEIKGLIKKLNTIKINKRISIKIKSIFSHLAASEAEVHDDFTKKQIALFQKIYGQLVADLGYRPIRHILNSSGIVRFPEYQMDMARLGIGLYGIDESNLLQQQLQTVNTLKATISQIKMIEKGETVGYGRSGKADSHKRIATLSIGYADGLLRKAGNGNYTVLINGEKAPLIGNVCMDMTMVDITHIPSAAEGDEVIIFGKDSNGNELPVQGLAHCLGTIPYEIFTSISSRVKRVYVQE